MFSLFPRCKFSVPYWEACNLSLFVKVNSPDLRTRVSGAFSLGIEERGKSFFKSRARFIERQISRRLACAYYGDVNAETRDVGRVGIDL